MLRIRNPAVFLASALPLLCSACLMAADEDMNPTHNEDLNNQPSAQPAPHSSQPNPSAPVADDPAPTTPVGVALSRQDANFITCAASAGMFEIKSSQWALDHGLNGEPAKFAHAMIAYHTKVAQQLEKLVTSKGLTLPDGMTKDDRKELDKLAKTPDNQLGKAYVEAQLAAHQTAVQLFTDEAAHGKDADLRAFAAANVDTLKQHQAHAQSVQ